ncbi:MAG: adenosine deaminase [Candidatus Didemnitutus sp.]|nr:adenosine deaminase [Candidatus Didemnitutus sp.]
MSDPSLPLIDLHRHLDGSLRIQTILDLARQHNVRLPGDTVETLRPHVQVQGVEADLLAFLAKLDWMVGVLGDVEACRRVARENLEDAKQEGIAYLELRFSPYFMARTHGLNMGDVVAAIAEGAEEGSRATGVKVKLIGILSRTFGPETCRRELEALLEHRHHLAALDLAGDERNWPAELFIEHFKRGRDAGWAITVHAGEAGGAASVWAALRELGATRIGHGVRAIDDPRLLDHLAAHRIGLEVSLTSNLQTNTVADYPSHPLKQFLEHGLLATINTDDPGISNIDLKHELEVAAPAAGLTPAQILQARRNALEIAYLSADEKAALLAGTAR